MNEEELIIIESYLISLIIDFKDDVTELECFIDKLNSNGLNLSYLYRTAIFHGKDTLSNTILSNTNYDINKDDMMKPEIVFWATYDKEDCIERTIKDGYILDISNILEVLDVLKFNLTETNKNNLLNLFTYYQRTHKVNKILQRIYNNPKRHLTN